MDKTLTHAAKVQLAASDSRSSTYVETTRSTDWSGIGKRKDPSA